RAKAMLGLISTVLPFLTNLPMPPKAPIALRTKLGAPSGEHQWVLGALYRFLHEFVTKQNTGIVLTAPLDIVFQREPVRTRQPDLFFLSKERGGTPEQIRKLKRLEVPPDIAIEIVSPSEEEETERLERKLND
ncbi:MAG: Uma2 family endonuclease, partial [Armatimonadota bacterium]|nr:Uma2 family endonuclease [Armatimonadota bacterium]